MVVHIPVLIDRIVEILEDSSVSVRNVIDATLGLGGYSWAVLERWPESSVLGIDQDKDALDCSRERLAPYGKRVSFVQANFRNLEDIAKSQGFYPADVAFFDLGVSNLQLKVAGRGFSYQIKGPLDMRMFQAEEGTLSAYDVFNTFSIEDMSFIFSTYGEERHAYKFAKILVHARETKGVFETTEDVILSLREGLSPSFMRKLGRHPGRKIFQAVRIYVNDELTVLKEALDSAPAVLSPGGVLCVISYHSLEDRIVKNYMRQWKQEKRGHPFSRKPIQPSEEEVDRNYKSRSAKLRIFYFSE